MGKLLIRVNNLIRRPSHSSETDAGPTFAFGKAAADDPHRRERMSDWSESKLTGKIVAMRVSFQGRRCFDGPKRFAFERMLNYADQRGRTVVVVLPVSPAYAKAFLPPQLAQEFEDALLHLQRAVPQSQWLRLDKLVELSSPDKFCDLGHLNTTGKQIATDALRAWLNQPVTKP